jgi:hypothetical protein
MASSCLPRSSASDEDKDGAPRRARIPDETVELASEKDLLTFWQPLGGPAQRQRSATVIPSNLTQSVEEYQVFFFACCRCKRHGGTGSFHRPGGPCHLGRNQQANTSTHLTRLKLTFCLFSVSRRAVSARNGLKQQPASDWTSDAHSAMITDPELDCFLLAIGRVQSW